jgi:hypothetical protein
MGKPSTNPVLCDYCDQPVKYYNTQGDRFTRRYHCGADACREMACRLSPPAADRIERFHDVQFDDLGKLFRKRNGVKHVRSRKRQGGR